MRIDLSGTAALVTGASRGIGRAVAEALAEAGARVGVHYAHRRDEAEALARRLGGQAFRADLAQPGAADTLWAEALAAFGRIDAVVANAGVFEEAPLEGPDEQWARVWDRTLALNLRSVADLARRSALHARQRAAAGATSDSGVAVRLVTVSSRAAYRGDDPEFLAYAASKGGVVALTKSLARAGGGLAAFGVAPGFTRTDMTEDALATREAEILGQGALARVTEPADLAPLVVLLASGLADHATGTTIDVNAASFVR